MLHCGARTAETADCNEKLSLDLACNYYCLQPELITHMQMANAWNANLVELIVETLRCVMKLRSVPSS